VAYWRSIGTKIGDIQWPWTAQWPSLCVISHKTADFWANGFKLQSRPTLSVTKM